MEDAAIVIMLKEMDTGFLVKELGSYKLEDGAEQVVHTVYAQDVDGERMIFLRLGCDRELEDWEFEAVFDYYDTEVMQDIVESTEEEEGFHNPVWLLRFVFIDNQAELEEKLNRLIQVHQNELRSVYEAIADKKDDYFEENDK